MLKAPLFGLVLTLIFAGLASSAEEPKAPQSSLKIEEVTDQKNKVDGDIDQEIQNARLRADSGSKSKFSLSLKGAFTGGSIESPIGENRPKLSADPSAQAFTTFDLGTNARYRWTKNDSLTLGTGFGFVTPLQGRVNGKNDAINVNDPNVAYSRVAKVFGLQTVGSVSYAYGTSITSLSLDATHQVGISYNMMKDFGHGFNAGASVATGYNFYSSTAGENAAAKTNIYGHDKRTDYSINIYPQAEYAISKTASARTVFGYFNWRHLYGDQNSYRLLQTYVYQSFGIGWAVTRDIYLYPNVQFVPDNIRSDFTNVAMSATINIF